MNEIEDFYAEPATSDDSISISQPTKTEEVFVDDRRLDDIFVPEVKHQHNIKVAGTREKALPVQVNQDNKEHKNSAPHPSNSFDFFDLCDGRHSGSGHFITAGKARITIKPVSQPLDLSLTIFTSDDVSSTSLANMAIPGQLFNIQKLFLKILPRLAVWMLPKKRGAITVYNELSTDQPLIATTRFESADRHIFHTLTSIVVPAGKISSGKFVPGSKEVQLIADKAGSEYNVPAGPFTIPAFKEQGAAENIKRFTVDQPLLFLTVPAANQQS